MNSSNDTASLSSSVKECSQLCGDERWKLAVDACKQAVQDLEGTKGREEFAESLLLLAESQERYENPWMALDAVKRVLHETTSKKHQERALVRKARIHIKFGDFALAREAAQQMQDKDRQNAVLVACERAETLYKALQESYASQSWPDVDEKSRVLIKEHTPYFGEAFDMQIRALSALHNVERAIDVARSKAHMETDPSETDFLIGKLYLSTGSVANGRKYIIECCKLNPENRKCMALRGAIKTFEATLQDAEKSMLLQEAINALEQLGKQMEAVSETEPYHDSNFPRLFHGFRPAVMRLSCLKKARQKHLAEAVEVCEEAKKLNPNSQAELLIALGEMYLALDQYDDALRSFREAQQVDPKHPNVRDLVERAEKVKREKWATRYYDTLGVGKDASQEEIKKAHSKMVRKYHPDKIANDEGAKKEAERKMQEINAAYDVLGDKTKRGQYDQGFDPNDPHAAAHGGFNPFAGGGFGGFRQSGGGGGHQFFFNMEDLFRGAGSNGRKGKKKDRRGGFDFFRDDL